MTSILTKHREAAGQSLEALGAVLFVNKSTILRWERDKVPAERVIEVERATGVPRHELRPDLYPPVSPVQSA